MNTVQQRQAFLYLVNRDEIINNQMQYYTANRDRYLAYMREYNRAYHLRKKAEKQRLRPKKMEPIKEPKPKAEPKPKKPKAEKVKSVKPVKPVKEVPVFKYTKGNFELSFD